MKSGKGQKGKVGGESCVAEMSASCLPENGL